MSQQPDNVYDGILMQIIQSTKSVDGFFDAVFGFLRRNTDFFTDPKKGEKTIVDMCKKHFDLYAEQNKNKIQQQAEQEERDKIRREKAEREAKVAQQASQQKGGPTNLKMMETEKSKDAHNIVERVDENGTKVTGVEEGQALPGNGGRTESYIWTQTLKELNIYIPVADTTKGKDLQIDIKPNHLSVKFKNQSEPIIDGELAEQIRAEDDESVWTLETGIIPYSK